jgi:hypothetical protein
MKEYKIKNIRDFLQVPPERLDKCLADFKEYLGYINHLEKTVAEEFNSKVESHGFTWIDDGKQGLSGLVFRDKQTNDVIAKVKF